MIVNRYRWTPGGMIYDRNGGDFINFAAHAAIVTFYENQIDQLDNSKQTQIVSIETELGATTVELDERTAVLSATQEALADKVAMLDVKEQELFDALVRIEELERALPATPIDEVRP